MEIKDLKLIPPSKRATAFFRNFIKEHDKGLKAIKTLAEIKEIAEPIQKNTCFGMYCGVIDEILKIINEVENKGGINE